MKSYGYIRVSSEEQLKGDGVGRQRKKLNKYADATALTVSKTYIDEGLSAYSGANVHSGKLGEFMQGIELGSILTPCNLIVENADRLSRDDPDEAQYRVLSLTRAGVTIHIIGGGKAEPCILKKGMPVMDLIRLSLESDRSNQESRYKQDRLNNAWESKRELAIQTGKPMTTLTPGWIALVDGKFVLIPERVKIVLRIIKELKSGLGRQRIATSLNVDGIDTWGRGKRKGLRWHYSYITKILTNPALHGEYQPHTVTKDSMGKRLRNPIGDPISDYFPTIITKAEFDEVQRITASNRVRRGRKDATGKGVPCNLLTGMVYSLEDVDGHVKELPCVWTNKGRRKLSGGSRTAPRVVGEGYWIYYSPKHPRLGKTMANYEYTTVEQTILKALLELTDEDIQPIKRVTIDPAIIEEKQLLQEHKELKKQLDNFLNVIASGTAPASILERIETLERDIRIIDVKLPKVRARQRPITQNHDIPQKLSEVKELAKGFDPENLEARETLKSAIQKLIKKVVLTKNSAYSTKAKGLMLMGLTIGKGHIMDDPIKKRSYPLFIHITFAGGAKRAVIAGHDKYPNQIISGKIDPAEQ